MSDTIPYISAGKSITEFSFRVFIIALFLTVILAIANAYLALKLGILTSASIPAAILSIGILRFFKDSTILENNLVQTAASAGEAVAGGVVYTIPALIIIGYWHRFDYITNFLIAACGGVLGVLFSIPLRRILVNEKRLRFPEGQAIAEVLKSSASKIEVRDLVYGGLIGAILELFQVGFKVVANSWSYWFVAQRSLFGFGAGFSATMIGAGFLVGHDMAISIFMGAVIAWLIAMPITSRFYPDILHSYSANDAVVQLWNQEMRYLGIGAMLFAGVWTFAKLFKPLVNSIIVSIGNRRARNINIENIPRTDRDLPMSFILVGTLIMALVLFYFFQSIFPLNQAGFFGVNASSAVLASVFYVLLFGFLFSVVTAYFSGMVGVTASPGSSVVIAGILLAAWILQILLGRVSLSPPSGDQIKALEAITIIIGSVVTGIAAIANDNSQDLKVGQLVGATPWKQQLMLLFGVLVSSLVIPPVMQSLFDVYGIAGVMPREGMDVSLSLPAPTAGLLAAITEAVFNDKLPWLMIGTGGLIILVILLINHVFKLYRFIQLSVLGVAIGMYLPLASTVPLFLGGIIASIVNRRLHKQNLSEEIERGKKQIGTLIACGLVAGSALLDVVLTIPFSIWHSPEALRLVSESWHNIGVVIALIAISALAVWIDNRVLR